MVKVMIHKHNTLMQFCAEAFNTACYTVNRIFLRWGTKRHLMDYGLGET